MMPEIAAKNAVRTLVEEVASMAVNNGLPLDKLRGVALYDVGKDAALSSLPAFDSAKQAVTKIPNFIGRFGSEDARVVLQFVYQYFSRIDSIRYEDASFEGLWCDFTAEVQDAYWVGRGVANLRNFDSE